MRNKTKSIIRMFIAILKFIIGFSILSMGGKTNSIILIFGGAFLMMPSISYIVPIIFDTINDWNIRRLDKLDAKIGEKD